MSAPRRPCGRPAAALVPLLLAAACGGATEATGPATGPPDGGAHRGDFVEDVDGLWVRPRVPLGAAARRELERLRALGYEEGYEPAPRRSGVTVHDRERAAGGVNLVTSGHAPEALLLDMEGERLHAWRLDYAAIPGALPPEDRNRPNAWRRAHLLPDGSLLAIYDGHGLVRVDRDSRLLWYYAGWAHHDLDVADDGTIWLLDRRAALLPRLHAERPIVEDLVTVLSPAGEVLDRFSLLECFEGTAFEHVLTERSHPAGDIFHTNAISILEGRIADRVPAFRRGNLLLSMRHDHTLFVVDPLARAVVWTARGPWRSQHDPRVLANGNLLLFDNAGHRRSSRILELDPATLEVEWSYRGDPPESFFSLYCGTSQRLPNGNTLVSETNNGRAFEITPAGAVVWEWINPHRAGDDDELIAAVFEVERLPAAPAWLGTAAGGAPGEASGAEPGR